MWQTVKVDSKDTRELERKLAEGWEPYAVTTNKVRIQSQLEPVLVEYIWLKIRK